MMVSKQIGGFKIKVKRNERVVVSSIRIENGNLKMPQFVKISSGKTIIYQMVMPSHSVYEEIQFGGIVFVGEIGKPLVARTSKDIYSIMYYEVIKINK